MYVVYACDGIHTHIHTHIPYTLQATHTKQTHPIPAKKRLKTHPIIRVKVLRSQRGGRSRVAGRQTGRQADTKGYKIYYWITEHLVLLKVPDTLSSSIKRPQLNENELIFTYCIKLKAIIH